MAQIVAIGEILVEIMATRIGQTFLEPGLFAGPYPSGAPAIFADQAARVGASTALISCVGPDDFGTLNLNRLTASGVEVAAVRRVPGTTTGSALLDKAVASSGRIVWAIEAARDTRARNTPGSIGSTRSSPIAR